MAIKQGDKNYLEAHLNSILRDLQNKNKLIFNSDSRKRKSFYLNYENYKNGIVKYKVKVK